MPPRALLRHRIVRAALATGLCLTLAAPAHAAPPAHGAQRPAAAAPTPDRVAAARQAVTAAPRSDVYAQAGRSGKYLGRVWARTAVSTPYPEKYVGSPVRLLRKRGTAWVTVATKPLADPQDAPFVAFSFKDRSAATLRIVVPALGLASPVMRVPRAPRSPRSRSYVRTAKGGGELLRVFKDGTAYAIWYADLEYLCLAGRLSRNRLTLTTFDFGGSTHVRRTSGSWKRLRIKDRDSRAVGGARRSLKGTSKRMLQRCSDPTYAAVTTDPSGI